MVRRNLYTLININLLNEPIKIKPRKASNTKQKKKNLETQFADTPRVL